jgi:hypothetical protein
VHVASKHAAHGVELRLDLLGKRLDLAPYLGEPKTIVHYRLVALLGADVISRHVGPQSKWGGSGMSGFAMKTAGVFLPLLKPKGAHGARGGAPLTLQPHQLAVASVVVQFRQRKLSTQPHSTGRKSLL